MLYAVCCLLFVCGDYFLLFPFRAMGSLLGVCCFVLFVLLCFVVCCVLLRVVVCCCVLLCDVCRLFVVVGNWLLVVGCCLFVLFVGWWVVCRCSLFVVCGLLCAICVGFVCCVVFVVS